ncbi:MAG: bifunctional folylpolyglutamate synthase/dihydrofolate synthase [Fluviicola sp.]
MNYVETISWLFEQFPAYHNLGEKAYNPGLKNIDELCAFFGNPHRDLRFVHIAGTNGKGSVSNFTASILQESGLKVGLFTSPHLFDFTERIRINGTPIEKQFVIDFCEQVRKHTWNIQPSFFEITWAMALLYFKEQNCELVVAEVGLGGRLDATNIITPLLSVITNIGLDHTHILGDTRAKIAFEKGGIIKKGIPVLLGEIDSETFPVFEALAMEKGTELIPAMGESHNQLGYQKRNVYLVEEICKQLNLQGIHISQQNTSNGIENVGKNTHFWGRLSIVASEPSTIVDCAHNVEGISELMKSIPETKGRFHFIYGTSSDKDLTTILHLFPLDANYYITEFSSERSAKLPYLKEKFENRFKNIAFFENPLEAYKSAQQVVNKEDTLVIFGSFFLVHDFSSLFFPKTLAE